MSPEQWDSARELFQAAMELPPERRSGLLNAWPDSAVRAEVESLLSAAGRSHGPLGETAIEGAKRALQAALAPPARSEPLAAGQTIGHYQILAPIGAGGMGEVYRARDTRLKREVALKVLPKSFAGAPDRMIRFQREAEVLASLNHSNIAQIYGVEDRALVMELVEGQNLKGPLPLKTALDYACQIAEALEYAHEKGVVHRDLKPANVKITPQGVVKVLDFGLAKAAERPTPYSGNPEESPTVTLTATQPGMIMGTAAYMSPEQASGRAVDKRSDVWSFGVVLWEMLTGRRLFQGESTMHILADVLRADIDFDGLPEDTPAPVRDLLMRCLDRDPKTRLRDLGEARVMLRKLLAETPGVASAPKTIPSRQPTLAAPRSDVAWKWRIAAVAVAVAAVALAGAWFYSNRERHVPGPEEWKQVTNFPDSATGPALSADGRTLAFARGSGDWFITGGGDKQIYVKRLPDGQPVRLTHDARTKMAPAFSPDGSRVVYTVGGWDTWIVPVSGGEPQRMLNLAEGLTWIDTHRVLFSELKPTGMGLETAQDDRTSEREIYMPNPAGMAHFSSLSPDKNQILVAEMVGAAPWLPCRLVPFDGSSTGHRVGPDPAECTAAVWTPDGKWMYFAADAERGTGKGFHIWRQRVGGSMPEQVTFGPTEQQGLAMAPDGKSIYTSSGNTQASVWVHDAKGDRRISGEGTPSKPVLSRDGTKAYYLAVPPSSEAATFPSAKSISGVLDYLSLPDAAGAATLNVADLRTGEAKPVLPDVKMTEASISGDGKSVLYAMPDKSRWIAALDGQSPPRRLPVQDAPAQAGSSGALYVTEREDGTPYLYKMQPDGTGRKKIFEQPFNPTLVSPDERWIVSGGGARGYQALPVDGRPPVIITAPSEQDPRGGIFRWSHDGKMALFTYRALAGGTGATIVVPLSKGAMFPPLPPDGLQSENEVTKLPGAVVIPYESVDVGPGMTYVYVKVESQHNIFQIPLQ